jgi:3-hydroxyacyl-CoA dehydrogenase
MAQVTWRFSEGVAWVEIDAPPVNALSHAVRSGLMEAADAIRAQSEITAVVLSSAGRIFCAGADINELGQASQWPSLPETLDAIENSAVPWVAVVQGAALGGGLELIMACHARIAAQEASFGLPEVNLGTIPGAGGTVRLPRLVPMPDAIDLVTGGRQIDAGRAVSIGLVDRLVSGDLKAGASTIVAEIAAANKWTKTITRQLIPGEVDWEAHRRRLSSKSRGAIAPLEALAALQAVSELLAPDALAEARARFLRLSAGPEAAALRHLFKAERAAGHALHGLDDINVNLDVVGVVGGGTMGASIAAALLIADLDVLLLEQSEALAEQARERVLGFIASTAQRGLLSPSEVERLQARLSVTHHYEALGACDLIIEAVFEDMAVKSQVFARLEAAVPETVILATNTSYLDVDALARTTKHPERVLGLHFFAPAHVMKLLEVVRGEKTDRRSLAIAGRLAKKLKKIAVVSGVCEGFIGNRILAAYRRECEEMLLLGALPEEIDAAMKAFGFPMGIFEVQDMSGLDIAWAQRKARAANGTRQPREGAISDLLCAEGRFGRKAGRGWYAYDQGQPGPDPEVTKLILETSAREGIVRRLFTAADITNAILGTMRREGQAILSEAIADSPDDIDVVLVAGYGFPRHKGGPMYQARTTPTANSV